ncbi:MAG TPA: hypothetical protein VJ550_05785 [Geomonas sp.]|nr:hypothetical protein [Geomonas sp.]
MKRKYHPRRDTPLLFCLIVLIAYWDYRSGFRFSLFPLYLIPLTALAWFDGRAVTLAASLLAGVIILVKDTVASNGVRGFYFFWDEAIKVVLLLMISFGVWKIRQLLREKDRSNQELREALSEIRELREMIPICAWCHSVRNDKGFYERIEVYLSQLTGASLTHGICPACMKKYYAELGNKEQTPGKTKKPGEMG